MLNQFTGMGRLTADPVLRYTKSNTPVASFTLAIEDDIKDANGNKHTNFIDMVAWRQTGEFVSKYFTKGSMACVTGRLQLRDWTDKEGVKRRAAEVNVEHVYFAGEKKTSAQSGAQAPVSETQDYTGPVQAPPDFDTLADDDGPLPF